MKTLSIRQKVFQSFFVLLLALCVCTFGAGFYIIKIDILNRAQQQVNHELVIARSIYTGEIDSIKNFFDIVSSDENLFLFKEKLGLDYLFIVNAKDASSHKSEIVQKAFADKSSKGSRIIGFEELRHMGQEYVNNAAMAIKATPKAKPTKKLVLKDAMAIEYARAIYTRDGKVSGVVYDGKIINKDFELVDKISDLVFVNKIYDDKPIGTVTIFQGDVRIATNVLGKDGERAVGTRVSEIVYNKVIEKGETWSDRAFVVTDWYMTAYEPIKNINGEIIGILYIGTLEKPFIHMVFKAVLAFLGIGVVAVILWSVSTYLLAKSIVRPIDKLLAATELISGGQFVFKQNRTVLSMNLTN